MSPPLRELRFNASLVGVHADKNEIMFDIDGRWPIMLRCDPAIVQAALDAKGSKWRLVLTRTDDPQAARRSPEC